MDTETSANAPAAEKPDNRVVLGILSYLGPLVIISYLVGKDDPFVKFHIKQGLILLIINAIMWALSASFWPLWPLWNLVNLFVLVLVVIGIINVINHREKELPVVGSLAKHFTF